MNSNFFNFCNNNQLEKAKDFYENTEIDLNSKDPKGFTPLCAAVNHGHIDIVKWLVSIHSPLNETDTNGRTALVVAINNKKIEIAKFLIEQGIDISIGDVNHKTPLHYAAQRGLIEIVELLLNHGAVETKDIYGTTPSMYANKKEIVNFLLEYKYNNTDAENSCSSNSITQNMHIVDDTDDHIDSEDKSCDDTTNNNVKNFTDLLYICGAFIIVLLILYTLFRKKH